MKDRALSTLGLWVVVGLVIWVGGMPEPVVAPPALVDDDVT